MRISCVDIIRLFLLCGEIKNIGVYLRPVCIIRIFGYKKEL
jgi:hypothetical protein